MEQRATCIELIQLILRILIPLYSSIDYLGTVHCNTYLKDQLILVLSNAAKNKKSKRCLYATIFKY